MRILGYYLDPVETLIAANVLVFFLMFFNQDFFFNNFSLLPDAIARQPWTIITSMFLHADFTHILFNMIALFSFGIYLERLVGGKEFLRIYFLGGIFAGLAYLFTSLFMNIPPPNIAAVGASGAIFAVMGTLVLLRPRIVIFVYFIPMPLYLAAVIYTMWALYSMAFPEAFAGMEIAHNAHLGGLVAGLYFGTRLKKKGYGENPG